MPDAFDPVHVEVRLMKSITLTVLSLGLWLLAGGVAMIGFAFSLHLLNPHLNY